MKISLSIFISLLLFSVLVQAQDDDDWTSKEYPIKDFSKVYLKGGFKVHLIQGEFPGLTIKTRDEDVLDKIEVDSHGDELRIGVTRDYLPYERIRLYITFNKLRELKMEGGLNVYSEGYLDLDDFLLHVQGGAKVDFRMKAEDVKVIGEGGVVIDLNGVAQKLSVQLSGAGHVRADELKVKHADFEIEGVGTGSVYATETLNASIEGVGKIRYKGEPRVIQNIEGLGSVTKD
ncbi:MAG: head GIN domain-containing protein [Draconibacterium sp.]